MGTRLVLVVAGSALALGLGGVSPASGEDSHPSPSHVGQVQTVTRSAEQIAAACYQQMTDDNGVGIISQRFREKKYGIYGNRGADDFTLGTACTVQSVDVVGAYFNGPGPAHYVRIDFYADNAGAPGEVIASQRVKGVRQGRKGSLHMTFETPLTLEPGTYWISVRVVMAFQTGGEWGWETTNTQTGNAALWRNPGNGFSTGCRTFAKLQTCIASDEGPDFMFAVNSTT